MQSVLDNSLLLAHVIYFVINNIAVMTTVVLVTGIRDITEGMVGKSVIQSLHKLPRFLTWLNSFLAVPFWEDS